MSKISPDLLTDTLNLVALARETALARGGQAQADRLTPVVDSLRELASAKTASPVARDSRNAPASGALAEDDFQALLAATQSAPVAGAAASGALDRSQVALAMAAGGMAEVDTARYLGATREEVRLMLASSHFNGGVK